MKRTYLKLILLIVASSVLMAVKPPNFGGGGGGGGPECKPTTSGIVSATYMKLNYDTGPLTADEKFKVKQYHGPSPLYNLSDLYGPATAGLHEDSQAYANINISYTNCRGSVTTKITRQSNPGAGFHVRVQYQDGGLLNLVKIEVFSAKLSANRRLMWATQGNQTHFNNFDAESTYHNPPALIQYFETTGGKPGIGGLPNVECDGTCNNSWIGNDVYINGSTNPNTNWQNPQKLCKCSV